MIYNLYIINFNQFNFISAAIKRSRDKVKKIRLNTDASLQ